MKVLITGFEPFGEEMINPATMVLDELPLIYKGANLVKKVIPTVAYKSIEVLKSYLEEEKPDVLICLGQAGGRCDLSVEKVGINWNDFRIADNEGNKPIDTKIFPDGETAYFSTLPIKSMVKRMKEQKIPASVSFSAGTFVCNHLFYGGLYLSKKYFPALRVGFIHIPYCPAQVMEKTNTPSMELSTVAKGLLAAISVILEGKEDEKIPLGTLH